MAQQTEWESKAANLLKAELKRKGVTYAQLVDKLSDIGIEEKERTFATSCPEGSLARRSCCSV